MSQKENNIFEPEVTTTKEALMMAAGELFAEYGVDATSIRAIAEKCQANIAGVNYHFGTKENLHLAVVQYVLEQIQCHRAMELLNRKEEWRHDPLRRSEAIYSIVEERCEQYFTNRYPRWYGRLFMRILLHPTKAVSEIIKEMVIPDFYAVRDVLSCCRPSMSLEEANLWTDTLVAQLTNYIFAEDLLDLFLEPRPFDAHFQKRILYHVSTVMIRGLELPLPVFLQEGTPNV